MAHSVGGYCTILSYNLTSRLYMHTKFNGIVFSSSQFDHPQSSPPKGIQQ